MSQKNNCSQQQEKGAKPESDKPNNENEHPFPAKSTEVECPKCLINKNKPQNDRDNKYQKWDFYGKYQKWGFWIQVGLFISTTLAFFAASIYAYFAYLQLETMKNSSKAFEVMAQKQNRAYIHVQPARLFNLHTNAPVQSYTSYGNTGNTFALNVKRYIGMKVMTLPGLDRIKDISSMMQPVSGIMVISPKLQSHKVPIIKELPNRRTLTIKEVEAIQNGKSGIYVFGKITYDDVFGIRHETGFCHVYYGSEYQEFSPTGIGYDDFQAKYCNKHNYAK